MDDARIEFETAVEVSRDALAAYRADPSPRNFRIWRDASEVAIKWCRAQRLNSSQEDRSDDELQALLAG
jgi:predicted kinase